MFLFDDCVFVKIRPHDSHVDIKFKFIISADNPRMFSFHRDKNEPVKTCLLRMEQNILKALSKLSPNSKKMHLNDQNGIDIKILNGDNDIDFSLNHVEAWSQATVLKVGDKAFNIIINGPSVKDLKLSKTIFVGYPTCPELELEFASFENSQFYWYREGSSEESEWDLIVQSFIYIPTNEDLGKRLKFKCIPVCDATRGYAREEVTKMQVEPGPGILPCEKRHAFTQSYTTDSDIRVVSYNILADAYADSDTGRNVLFQYCVKFALNLDYRKNLILKELLGYKADIICLQEVDSKLFKSDLNLVLKNLDDMEGLYAEKSCKVREGVSCFFRKSRFTCLDSRSEPLSLLFFNDLFFLPYLNILSSNVDFMDKLRSRNSVGLFVLLKDELNPSKALLVVNTHLYYHPDASNIRLMQASIIVIYVENLIKKYERDYPNLKISPLICGDFNSVPESWVYHLMTTGFISDDYPSTRIKQSKEEMKGMNVAHSLSLESACGTPVYTNYTCGFQGCLDYIFFGNSKLKVKEVIPFPSHEEVILHKAIPSVIFPSDHLALVSVLSWK